MANLNDVASALRRRPYPFVLAFLLVSLVLFYGSRREGLSPEVIATPRVHAPTAGSDLLQDSGHPSGRFGFDGTWNYTRDYRNLVLTQRQCDLAFPGLFEEVERPVQLRREKKVTRRELDETPRLNGFIRAMIFDQQVCAFIFASAVVFCGRWKTRVSDKIQANHQSKSYTSSIHLGKSTLAVWPPSMHSTGPCSPLRSPCPISNSP